MLGRHENPIKEQGGTISSTISKRNSTFGHTKPVYDGIWWLTISSLTSPNQASFLRIRRTYDFSESHAQHQQDHNIFLMSLSLSFPMRPMPMMQAVECASSSFRVLSLAAPAFL